MLEFLLLSGGVSGRIARANAQPTGHVLAPLTRTVQLRDQRGLRGINARISIVAVDSSVKSVLEMIAWLAGMHVVYDSSTVVLTKRVTVRLRDARVGDVIPIVLKGTGLIAKIAIDGETIMVRSGSHPKVYDVRKVAGVEQRQRRLNDPHAQRPTLSNADEVPPDFQALVSEYYRSLSRSNKNP